MTRRDIAKLAALGISARALAQKKAPESEPLTGYVADFIVNTRFEDIPADVLDLARKSILDGLGLSLCGSVAKSGEIVRQFIKATASPGTATVVGSPLKTSPRFAAFANAVNIHADDYDDTQLAVAENRTYGLLTHPTAPALPPVFASW